MAKIERTRKECELLVPHGAILRPSWGPLGAVLALGSPSLGVLGRLEAFLSPLKIDVKIDQEIDACQNRFLYKCSSIFASKMNQITTKMELKIDLILDWVKKRKLL